MAHRKTSNALNILYRHFYEGKPERLASLELERQNTTLARRKNALRTRAGLTQRQLAARAGTTATVISRLENAAYDGYSLSMLRHVAAALDINVEVRFVSRTPAGG